MIKILFIIFFTVWVISGSSFAETMERSGELFSQTIEGQRLTMEVIPQSSQTVTDQKIQRGPSPGKVFGYMCLGGGLGTLIGGAIGIIIGLSYPSGDILKSITLAFGGLEIGGLIGGGIGVGIGLHRVYSTDASEKSTSLDHQGYGMIVRYSWRF